MINQRYGAGTGALFSAETETPRSNAKPTTTFLRRM